MNWKIVLVFLSIFLICLCFNCNSDHVDKKREGHFNNDIEDVSDLKIQNQIADDSFINCDLVFKEYSNSGHSNYLLSLVNDSIQNLPCFGTNGTGLIYYSLLDSVTDFTKYLLKSGVSPDEIHLNKKLSTVKQVAIFGDIEIAKLLFRYSKEKFRKIYYKHEYVNALTLAIRFGKYKNAVWLSTFKELAQIDVDENDKALTTQPIIEATLKGYFDLFRILASYGADINTKATFAGEDCYPCMESVTPLHIIAALDQLNERVSESDKYKFVTLIKRKVDNIFIENRYGNTPLDFAAYFGDTTLIETIIEHKSFRQEYLDRGLLSASTFSDYSTVEFLLRKGANPNFVNKSGVSILENSVSCCGDGFGEGITTESRVNTIKNLIYYGLDISKKSDVGLQNIKLIHQRKEVGKYFKI